MLTPHYHYNQKTKDLVISQYRYISVSKGYHVDNQKSVEIYISVAQKDDLSGWVS